jgi:hypothetical protein
MTDVVIAIAMVASSTIAGIAAIYAARAEKNSRPVSNGFADHVREDLKEIRTMLIKHIENHD